MIRGSVLISKARLLTALVIFASGGVVAGHLAAAVAPGTGPAAPVVRVGVVQSSPAPTADTVWVQMVDGDDPIDLPYITSYIPVAGDEVNVLFQATSGSMQGLVLGGRSGQADNLVLNGRFTRHPAPSLTTPLPPYNWALSTVSGTAATFCAVLSSTYQRSMLMFFSSAGTAADNVGYSAAFSVSPAETLYVDAVFDAQVVPAAGVSVALKVAWFGEADKAWSLADSTTTVGTDTDTVAYTGTLSGTVTVPADAAYARVGFEVTFPGVGTYTVLVGQVDAHR